MAKAFLVFLVIALMQQTPDQFPICDGARSAGRSHRAACSAANRHQNHCRSAQPMSASGQKRAFGFEGVDQQDGPQRSTRYRADDAAELTRESRHAYLFKTNHRRATASEGVEYKSSYPSYPDAVHRHFPQSKIREKNFSPHAVMSSERVGRNQLSVGASSPSE